MKGRVVSLFSLGLISFGFAAQTPSDFDQRLQTLCTKLEAERQSQHIVGMSLAVVKDGKVILTRGFGYRDLANKLPVNADTLFCIGSSTKAMTAAMVMMAVEAGKVKLDANPNTYLPELHFYDPEIDKKITVSDIMSHRSGLTRVDLPWYTNALDTKETLKLVHDIQPTAKLGEKFQYSNIMFLAAGEIAARAFAEPYETLAAQKLFQPLGMSRTTMDPAAAQDGNFSKGYGLDRFTGEPKRLPFHQIKVIAPAGAVISNANDMAQWMRLMLAQGTLDGKAYFSADSYEKLTSPHMAMGPGLDYGYGWMLGKWEADKEVQHGGNIDGYSAMVAFLPKENLGYVLLTNQNAAGLQNGSLDLVFDTLLGKPKPAVKAAAADHPEAEAGDYAFEKTPAFHMNVTFRGGKLYFHPTGQPDLVSIPDGGRVYHLAPPAPDVKITFNPVGKDGLKSFTLLQAGQTLVFHGAKPYVSPIAVDDLLKLVEGSQGDVSKWRAVQTLVVKYTDNHQNQGYKSIGAQYHDGWDKYGEMDTMYAVGKRIGSVRVAYDGKGGWQSLDFAGTNELSGAELAVIGDQGHLAPQLDWKKRYAKIVISGAGKVGNINTYKVDCTLPIGITITYQVDQKTGQIQSIATPGGSVELQDYRTVNGLSIPYKRMETNGLGKSAFEVIDVAVDGWIPPSILDAPAPTKE